MRRIKKIFVLSAILMIFSLLCSCSTNQIKTNVNQDSNNYIANEDFQNYISEMSSFVKVKDGYYFTSDALLFYYDTENNQAYPVCNKTNCTHSDSNCQAYLSPLKFYPEMSMYYYDNALYLLGREKKGASSESVYIYQISLENFKQKKAAYLFDSASSISVVCIIHRGYVYFSYDGGEMEETKATLYRTKLGELSKNSPEKIFEFNGIGASIARLSAYGNKLFFNTSSYSDLQGNGYETVLNCMDIHTLENKTIPQRKYSHFADEGKVYYFKDENTVAYYDLSNQKHKIFCKIDGPCYISADDNYIYFDNLQSIIVGNSKESDRKIFVYDKSGKYVTEITPKNPKDDCYFGGDDMMIFKEIIADEVTEADGTKGYYVLDKSQLKSPDKQFIDME